MLNDEQRSELRKRMKAANEHYAPMAGPDIVLDLLDEIDRLAGRSHGENDGNERNVRRLSRGHGRYGRQ